MFAAQYFLAFYSDISAPFCEGNKEGNNTWNYIAVEREREREREM